MSVLYWVLYMGVPVLIRTPALCCSAWPRRSARVTRPRAWLTGWRTPWAGLGEWADLGSSGPMWDPTRSAAGGGGGAERTSGVWARPRDSERCVCVCVSVSRARERLRAVCVCVREKVSDRVFSVPQVNWTRATHVPAELHHILDTHKHLCYPCVLTGRLKHREIYRFLYEINQIHMDIVCTLCVYSASLWGQDKSFMCVFTLNNTTCSLASWEVSLAQKNLYSGSCFFRWLACSLHYE